MLIVQSLPLESQKAEYSSLRFESSILCNPDICFSLCAKLFALFSFKALQSAWKKSSENASQRKEAGTGHLQTLQLKHGEKLNLNRKIMKRPSRL